MAWVRSLGTEVPGGKADWMDPADGIDREALHRQYPEVFRYVSRRVPRQEAEDITMQVFAAALEALPQFRGECSLGPWLLSIAHKKVVDALRRRAARRETLASELTRQETATDPMAESMASAVEGPETALVRQEARQAMRHLVDQLNRDQREVLLLRYVEERSMAEIAAIMARSPAAVNSLLQRARATLFRLGKRYFLDDGGSANDE
jgi:RNA polymerase sigma-70 factor (ECF subfamily)